MGLSHNLTSNFNKERESKQSHGLNSSFKGKKNPSMGLRVSMHSNGLPAASGEAVTAGFMSGDFKFDTGRRSEMHSFQQSKHGEENIVMFKLNPSQKLSKEESGEE